MAKKISQETFDQIVRENIDDFELSEADALNDAIEQCKRQGIDLSNIDISGGIGRAEVMENLENLAALSKGERVDFENILKQTATLCSTSNAHYQRNRVFMLEYDGINSLHSMISPEQDQNVLMIIIELYDNLSKIDVRFRDSFEPGGAAKLELLMKKHIKEQTNLKLLTKVISFARTVAKSENNKNMLMKSGIADLLVQILDTFSELTTPEVDDLLEESCLLIRGMCIHDDLRKKMSCAFENGKYFLKQASVVPILMKFSSNFQEKQQISCAALLATRNLIMSEEAVQIVAQNNGLDLVHNILCFNDCSLNLMRSAIGLMRNICADDIRKDILISKGSLEQLLFVMSEKKYSDDPSLMEHGMACLAALSLRSPSNSKRIVNSGMALTVIVENMRKYTTRVGLLRQGCLTIRNIAARCPELRSVMLDAGVEPVLRTGGTFPEVVDEAYAALRDLGCDVQYVRLNEEGKIQPAYEQFGAVGKLQFNPIYDEFNELDRRIEENAEAPFHKHDDNCDH